MNGDDAFIDHWFHCAPGPLKELKATNESITTRLQALQDIANEARHTADINTEHVESLKEKVAALETEYKLSTGSTDDWKIWDHVKKLESHQHYPDKMGSKMSGPVYNEMKVKDTPTEPSKCGTCRHRHDPDLCFAPDAMLESGKACLKYEPRDEPSEIKKLKEQLTLYKSTLDDIVRIIKMVFEVNILSYGDGFLKIHDRLENEGFLKEGENDDD